MTAKDFGLGVLEPPEDLILHLRRAQLFADSVVNAS